MELRQLRYFVAVAESGSFSRAAQRMFLTQPALSRQIKALEGEVGQLLFERQAHSIRLTPAGGILLPDARELLQQADNILERMRACGTGVHLRVGYAPSLASGLLSFAVENLVQKHPDARVELLDLSTREMFSGLEDGTLDVIVTVHPDRECRGTQWTPLVEMTWQLAVPRNHPLAGPPSITPDQIAREPLLVFRRQDYPEYWNTITGWLNGIRPQLSIAGEYDGINSLLSAVESGLGIAMVTGNTARLIPERVKLKPVSQAPAPLTIAAGYHAGRPASKPCLVFIQELALAARIVS